jgi:CPA1 family monovalent cation:H+ antiporter
MLFARFRESLCQGKCGGPADVLYWCGRTRGMTMVLTLQTLIVLLTVIAAVAAVSRRVQIPAAILLVLVGVVLAFLPGLPAIQLAPQLVLLVILPPVVYWSAVAMSWREFRSNLRPISLLAFGCVAFTTAATASAAHYLLSFPWAVAFVLGAIVSPPDEVAPLSIARRLRLPARLQVILEGEGLANDATSLVLYRFAIAAVSTGTFSLAQASAEFAAIVAGEILWGIGVGWLMLRLRHRAGDTHVEILLSVLTPFLAYWPPQQLGGSGVLAAVSCGLYVSWNGPYLISAATRLQGIFFWDFLNYLIEGMVFLVTGLQARALIARISHVPLRELFVSAGIVCTTVIIARYVWVFPATYLPQWLAPARSGAPPSLRATVVLAFTGVRGLVSLAVALAIPLTMETGQPFPYRDAILFLTFSVILVTLVGQGLALPLIIRLLGLTRTGERQRRLETVQERTARREAIKAALEKLAELEEQRLLSAELLLGLRAHYADRLRQLDNRWKVEDRKAKERYDRVEDQLIATEREAVNALYRLNKLSDESRRRIEHDLDLRHAQLAKLRESDGPATFTSDDDSTPLG